MRISRPAKSLSRHAVVLFGSLVVASAASLSAHVIRGLQSPTLATAFVSSPTSGADAPLPARWGATDSGLRVVCFYVANTSPERTDRPGWPRVTGAGFELPGTLTGFSLLQPLDGNWELVEGARVLLAGHEVTLDFAVVARTNPTGRTPGEPDDPRGIPPGQAPTRGNGTRFCVSGPFPDELTAGQPTTIEQILNGVVVGFHGLETLPFGSDVGVWDNAARAIPLFPQ